jgi:alpha-L-fucosidase
MNHRVTRALAAVALVAPAPAAMGLGSIPSSLTPTVIVDTRAEPIAAGPFKPTWQSLQQYKVPDWFRNAKFGIWAHWGPQCEPEDGDWYARNMYVQGSKQNVFHVAHYGPPSQFGFKDVIHQWKAEKWDPDALMALYKRAGAQYFFALANHHDNFDLWDSKYQPWNAVRVGPEKDLIAGWAKAARAQGLKFGVSVHAAHAWSWYEVAQGLDKTGPLAGVPYDGKLTKADGKGTWWDGLDPQDLYAQTHVPSPDFEKANLIHARWYWNDGCSQPDQAYCDKFYDRTVDLINQAHPDLIYFDDTALPMWPLSDAGLKIAAHFYNSNMAAHGGKLEGVLFGKVLDEEERRTMVWDIERGQSDKIEPLPWQTDTCLGNWHYDRPLYDRNGYKSAATVIRTLADVVSKNGNLLLNVPVRGDGTIDEKERAIVEGIAAWMDVNKEAIFDTRPWKVCGEGPQLAAAAPLTNQGFNEGKGKRATGADVRYTAKDNAVYAMVLARPSGDVHLTALGTAAHPPGGAVIRVEQLGVGPVKWSASDAALAITPDVKHVAKDQTVVFKLTLSPS